MNEWHLKNNLFDELGNIRPTYLIKHNNDIQKYPSFVWKLYRR